MVKIAFSGRLRAGKDTMARLAGLSIVGFADPMYEICRHYFGSADKGVPGMRTFMQYIGQVGWGCVNEKYPVDVQRILWLEKMRREGPEIFHGNPLFDGVDWNRYGKSESFWVEVLLRRPDVQDHTYAATGIGIVNARFDHEFEPLMRDGFQHFHVMCTEKTRRSRIEHYDLAADNDTSEQMAIRLDREAPDHLVIWSDLEPMPEGRSYWTVDAFVKEIKARRAQEQALATA